MAKTKTEVKVQSPIESERTIWGVQLKIRPFDGITSAKSGAMVISADIQRPQRKGRKAEVRIWFSGVSGVPSLTTSEILRWTNSLRALMEEAERVGSKLRVSRAGA